MTPDDTLFPCGHPAACMVGDDRRCGWCADVQAVALQRDASEGDDAMSTLSERAVACRHFRWMPGMLVLGGDRITERTIGIEQGCAPDLSDPATVGCLLALVRRAWGLPGLAPSCEEGAQDGAWCVETWHAGEASTIADGDTEADALVAALEEAASTCGG